MQAKLSSWNKKSLSFAGRCTLIQSVLSTIPSYCMQTMKIPTAVCAKMDKIYRDFLWRSSDEERKVHLLNWEKICKPKEEGGLGIRRAQETNQLFLMKLAWGLIHKRDALWVQVMRAKYGGGDNTILKVHKKASNSNAWIGITKVWEEFQKNLIWRIGDGKSISFWDDHWIPGVQKLRDVATCSLDEAKLREKVSDYVNSQGNWNWAKLSQVLSEDILEHIKILKSPNPDIGADTVGWLPAADGNFSIKSAYEVYFTGKDNNSSLHKLLWKIKLPQRLKTFSWLLTHEALLTNSKRKLRNLTEDGDCPRCCGEEETLLHVLRDCPYIRTA
ncbi:hypothetical protein AHAS_Ahas03G0243100 [Arachis hypogaea]